MEGTSWKVYSFVAILGCILYNQIRSRANRRRPPGPKPWPLVGNVSDFPPTGMPDHMHWLHHKDKYGPISSITAMGTTLVFVHDKKMAHDLLNQLSLKTSGRPSMEFANKLCGYEAVILTKSYEDPMFRRHRKLLHRELGTPAAAAQFRHIQEQQTAHQLVRILDNPQGLLDHYKTTTAGSILSTTYGYTIEPHKIDPLISWTSQMLSEFNKAATPGAWAVDFLPALQYLPTWFPGTGFKAIAAQYKKSLHANAYLPYNFVCQQMSQGIHRPSYVSQLLDQLTPPAGEGKIDKDDETAVIWSAESIYGAASDTSRGTLNAITLAMIRFPEVQRRAQEEIDRVVGPDRLPNFSDRENLPYVDAIVKEATRWWPVAPMGFPHVATEGFEYEGYWIEKGDMILPAIWWFLHDPEVYKDPEEFDPARFLEPRSEPGPVEVWGFGRRICQGRFFADSAVFINVVQTLAVFHLEKAVGGDGKGISLDDVVAEPGVLSFPKDFAFRVRPRSEKSAELVREAETRFPFEESDAAKLQNPDTFVIQE